jgi:hypothetical protein
MERVLRLPDYHFVISDHVARGCIYMFRGCLLHPPVLNYCKVVGWDDQLSARGRKCHEPNLQSMQHDSAVSLGVRMAAILGVQGVTSQVWRRAHMFHP